MKKMKKQGIVSGICLVVFLLIIVGVRTLDVQAIGPENSKIGFATINQFVEEHIGVHMIWYRITDWLGIIALFVAAGFGVLGLVQMIKRKSLLKVDADILVLGVYYLIVIGTYILFELKIVNYRPVLMGGVLEASFPSSHTMIVICIMGAAVIQIQRRIKQVSVSRVLQTVCVGVILVTVIGRMISGVHWFSDIIAGIIFGVMMISLYKVIIEWVDIRKKP